MQTLELTCKSFVQRRCKLPGALRHMTLKNMPRTSYNAIYMDITILLKADGRIVRGAEELKRKQQAL